MSDWTAHDYGLALGSILGWMIIFGGPIAIGYFVANRLAQKRDAFGTVKWPIRLGFGISLFFLLGHCAQKGAPAHAEEFSTHG